MKKFTNRNTSLIFGILLLILGGVLLIWPLLTSKFVTFIVCFVMFLYGLSEIARHNYHKTEHVISYGGLANGIITSIFSLMLLFTPEARLANLGVLLAAWVLFTGVMRTVGALNVKNTGAGNWKWNLGTGVLGIAIGIMMLFEPLFGVMAISYTIPIIFFMQGISAIAMYFSTGRKYFTTGTK